jgi:hypothetical protein
MGAHVTAGVGVAKSNWAAWWGVGGILALLGDALWRLGPRAWELTRYEELASVHVLALVLCLLFFGAAEGYRGFQRAFAPRAAARALYLTERGSLRLKLLAPLFCMGLLHATRRRLIVNWLLVFGIVGLIIVVAAMPSPWREIVDAGVVLGLSWGAVALIAFFVRGLLGTDPGVSLELPPTTGKSG